MQYTIITENDVSEWEDRTGFEYHFPSRYLKFLQLGTRIIYYKGRLKEQAFKALRLSSQPHYFATATIRAIRTDKNSSKNDFYATLSNFTAFERPVNFKLNGKTLEKIPSNRKSNYWRDGVRPIDEATYFQILQAAELDIITDESLVFGESSSDEGLETILTEGGKRQVYSTIYERNQALRDKAVDIHGLTCMACGFNFNNFYGTWGEGYIHVHHVQPISTYEGKKQVNPTKDLVVLCANCHSMVHWKKDRLLTVQQLKKMIGVQRLTPPSNSSPD